MCGDFIISHGGHNYVYCHTIRQKHIENVKIVEANKNSAIFFKPYNNVIHSELLFTSFLAVHNVPLSTVSHAGPLF